MSSSPLPASASTTSNNNTATSTSNNSGRPRQRRNNDRERRPPDGGIGVDGSQERRNNNQQRRRRPPRDDSQGANAGGSEQKRDGGEVRKRRPPRERDAPPHEGDPKPRSQNKRGARFNGGLTSDADKGKGKAREPVQRYAQPAREDDDLATRLTRALSTAPYPDCPICFAPIRPEQPTWSCSPPHVPAAFSAIDGEDANAVQETAQCCWTNFHMKCIRNWAETSVKNCNRPCCPLAALAAGGKGKGKRKAQVSQQEIIDPEGWHVCDLVCGKPLACGNHDCEERDHKGVCPSCLRSSFEEMICYCGRTVLEPPIPCGTRINCTYPCTRGNPPCGHPRIPHACHEDPSPCPPCVVLTSKPCACGKQNVANVRCSQEKVSCGQATALKCSDECAREKRKAKLAEAFGVVPGVGGGSVQATTYSDELRDFARSTAHGKFVGVVEKAFADFLASDKKAQTLPHMPEPRRRFVYALASVYRMDAQMVDAEPHRSVQIIRRIDSRIPVPLLSTAIAQQPQRASTTAAWGAKLVTPQPAPVTGPAASRGWRSVVAQPGSVIKPAPPAPAPVASTSRLVPLRPSTSTTRSAVTTPKASAPVSGSATPVRLADVGDVPENWEDEA
ncbi:unnamed protein product [Peniophora sp. CBMAI 1063]|nr:unnamed protein product [Peniophora sp. CBMAI 1063]